LSELDKNVDFMSKISENLDVLGFATGFILLGVLISVLGSPVKEYESRGLATIFITTFSTLLGLAIASFSILFTIAPKLESDLRSAPKFRLFIKEFILVIYTEIAIVVLGILILFTSEGNVVASLIRIQLFLIPGTFLMLVVLTYYLYLMFKVYLKG
jgi:CDP-diglyceride synthetase